MIRRCQKTELDSMQWSCHAEHIAVYHWLFSSKTGLWGATTATIRRPPLASEIPESCLGMTRCSQKTELDFAMQSGHGALIAVFSKKNTRNGSLGGHHSQDTETPAGCHLSRDSTRQVEQVAKDRARFPAVLFKRWGEGARNGVGNRAKCRFRGAPPPQHGDPRWHPISQSEVQVWRDGLKRQSSISWSRVAMLAQKPLKMAKTGLVAVFAWPPQPHYFDPSWHPSNWGEVKV